jgi:hypothetical protein
MHFAIGTAVSSLSIYPNPLTFEAGKANRVYASATDAISNIVLVDENSLFWTSSNKAVAMVDSSGASASVRALKQGQATLSVSLCQAQSSTTVRATPAQVTVRSFSQGPANILIAEGTNGNGVYDFNPSTGAFLGYLPASGAVGLATDNAGNIYISELTNNDVIKYSPGSTTPTVFVQAGAGGLKSPRALAFGPDGNLYVASQGTSVILKFNGTTGASLGVFASVPGVFGLVWYDGNVYADSSFAFGGICELSGTTGQPIAKTQQNAPTGNTLCVMKDGTIYQAAGTSGVVAYAPDTLALEGTVMKTNFAYSVRGLNGGGFMEGELYQGTCRVFGPEMALQSFVIAGGGGPQDEIAVADLTNSGMLSPPGQLNGGGLYFQWNYATSTASELDIQINSSNSPGTDKGLFFSSQLTCGTPSLSPSSAVNGWI